MLHRQWLTVRRAGGLLKTDQQKRTVRCLRDTVLLLHSLSQKDKLFTVHCVEVLHQYDQVMPGVSMLIRGLPDVTDCEGEPLRGPSLLQPICGFSLMLMSKSDSYSIDLLPPLPFLALGTLSSCSGSSLDILGCPLLLSVELA